MTKIQTYRNESRNAIIVQQAEDHFEKMMETGWIVIGVGIAILLSGLAGYAFLRAFFHG